MHERARIPIRSLNIIAQVNVACAHREALATMSFARSAVAALNRGRGRVCSGARLGGGSAATVCVSRTSLQRRSASSTSANGTDTVYDDAYVQKVLTTPVYDVCIETPLQRATQLSRKLHANVFLKREDMQPVFSFKVRERVPALLLELDALIHV